MDLIGLQAPSLVIVAMGPLIGMTLFAHSLSAGTSYMLQTSKKQERSLELLSRNKGRRKARLPSLVVKHCCNFKILKNDLHKTGVQERPLVWQEKERGRGGGGGTFVPKETQRLGSNRREPGHNADCTIRENITWSWRVCEVIAPHQFVLWLKIFMVCILSIPQNRSCCHARYVVCTIQAVYQWVHVVHVHCVQLWIGDILMILMIDLQDLKDLRGAAKTCANHALTPKTQAIYLYADEVCAVRSVLKWLELSTACAYRE